LMWDYSRNPGEVFFNLDVWMEEKPMFKPIRCKYCFLLWSGLIVAGSGYISGYFDLFTALSYPGLQFSIGYVIFTFIDGR